MGSPPPSARRRSASPRGGRSSTSALSSPRTPRTPPLESLQDYLGSTSTTLDYNIFFQNARIGPVAPRQNQLNPKHVLPEAIVDFAGADQEADAITKLHAEQAAEIKRREEEHKAVRWRKA